MLKKIAFSLLFIISSLLILSFFNDAECQRFGGIFSRKGRIMGTITNTIGVTIADKGGFNPNGEPIANVPVFAESMEKDSSGEPLFTSDIVLTDSDGEYEIRRVPVGAYRVVANPPEGEDFLANDTFNVNVRARRAEVVDMSLSGRAPDGANFIGANACLPCHTNNFTAWSNTTHARTVQDPTNAFVVAPFDGKLRSTSDNSVSFRASQSGREFEVTLFDLNDPSNSVTHKVVKAVGGIAADGEQMYLTKIGNSNFVLPTQFNFLNVDPANPDAAWVSFSPETWYNDDGTLRTPNSDPDSYEKNCEGCHSTGLNVERIGGEFVSSSMASRIECEACHGPGEFHVMSASELGPTNNIIRPTFLAADRNIQVCGQCHIRPVSKPGAGGANFEVSYPAIVDGDEIIPYPVGREDLHDFILLEREDGSDIPVFWNDDDESFGEDASENNHSKANQQHYIDYIRSGHPQAGVRCFECHDPHLRAVDKQLEVEFNNNELCLQCHPQLGDTGVGVSVFTGEEKVLNIHSKHPEDLTGSGSGRCVGCHMMATAKSAVFTDTHSHLLDIIEPQTSLAMAEMNGITVTEETSFDDIDRSKVIMNSCFNRDNANLRCHTDDKDFGVSRYELWFEQEVIREVP